MFLAFNSTCPVIFQQQGDKGNRKRYMPSDKDRPSSPPSKRMTVSPDRGEKCAENSKHICSLSHIVYCFTQTHTIARPIYGLNVYVMYNS